MDEALVIQAGPVSDASDDALVHVLPSQTFDDVIAEAASPSLALSSNVIIYNETIFRKIIFRGRQKYLFAIGFLVVISTEDLKSWKSALEFISINS